MENARAAEGGSRARWDEESPRENSAAAAAAAAVVLTRPSSVAECIDRVCRRGTHAPELDQNRATEATKSRARRAKAGSSLASFAGQQWRVKVGGGKAPFFTVLVFSSLRGHLYRGVPKPRRFCI